MKESIQQLTKLVNIRKIRVAIAQEKWQSAKTEVIREKLTIEQASLKVNEVKNDLLKQRQICFQFFQSNNQMSDFIINNNYLELLSSRLEHNKDNLTQSKNNLARLLKNLEEATKNVRHARARLEALEVQLQTLKNKQFRQRHRKNDAELEDLVMGRRSVGCS